ncbi:MAG: DNA mismatch repair endonuclease MutL [Elusimicrobia bacterium]|nr:DNA mismatch repair endonuclease MutL [Elusimicrobiota bacterium]
MPSIQLLPEEVASKIAAGEVIERPASVLKELLENSLDAGATKIQIEIEKAGKGLIRVVDNGSGISPEDCRIAFARHATSKIRDLVDLETLGTYGFRGEALFSIAAVSETTLISCVQGAREGFTLTFSGGKKTKEGKTPPIPGTTLEIRSLFFNTPARAKFLKSDPSERSQLLRVVEESALSHPQIQYILKMDGKEVWNLPAQLKDDPKSRWERTREILGDTAARSLIVASIQRPELGLTVFLSKPEELGSSRNSQYFFVNERPVTNRTLQQALYRSYEDYRPLHKHPLCVLFLNLAPAQFDINVHPQKKEIRFRSDHALFDFIQNTLQKELLKSKQPHSLQGSSSWLNAQNPRELPRIEHPDPQTYVVREEPAFYAKEQNLLEPEEPGPSWYKPPFRYLGQIEKTYLVYESQGGILLMDQHAGQERILFEQYLIQFKNGGPKVQRLMIPIQVDLSPSQTQKVMEWKDWLKTCGFDLDLFGKNSILVHSLPALFDLSPDHMKELLEKVSESQGTPAPEEVRLEAIATMACKKAVKAHDQLNPEEAVHLIEELKNCQDSFACPHGRPTLLKLTREELAHRFKRPGPPPL